MFSKSNLLSAVHINVTENRLNSKNCVNLTFLIMHCDLSDPDAEEMRKDLINRQEHREESSTSSVQQT